MSLLSRNGVKVLLLNNKSELLLMCMDDSKTTNLAGKYHGRFWFPIGGKIESHESIQEAAIREIYEETGISKNDIELGPIVWFGEFDLILSGTPTHIKEKFFVAKTKQNRISLSNLTSSEKAVVKKIAWFSLEKIKNSTEIIFPVLLSQYLPDIISGKYPEKPIKIDLEKQPDKF